MSKLQFKIARLVSSILFLLLANLLPIDEVFKIIFFVGAYLISGYDIVFKAIRNIIRGNFFDEFFLMSLATIGAFVLKEFNEAVGVMIFFQIGEFFQDMAVEKSRKSILSLMDLKPDYANVIEEDTIIKMNPNDVLVGSIVLVKPGEKIPLDGIIVEGKSSLNTASLTGESLPREVVEEDSVLSGSVNLNSPLKIKTTTHYSESTVMKILDMVENATIRKAKSEKFITKFARYYTPLVVLAAVILAFVPPIFLGFQENFTIWLYRAFNFLVVSCPCALVLSVPLSYFAGMGACAKHHILIKGSNYLEKMADIKYIVLDKTGTITKGNFNIAEIYAHECKEEDVLFYASIAEQMSNHPIAEAIKAYARQSIKPTEVVELPGLGIEASYDAKLILAGNKKLLEKYHIPYTLCETYGTVVYLAYDNKFMGYIRIVDEIKEDSKKAITNLFSLGIEDVIMLTGDRKESAKLVANEVGVSNYYAELLPQDKVEIVKRLMQEKKEKKQLAFVGDGINDAPVLAMADIGFSMGGIGSDAAIEASDVVLLKDDLNDVYDSILIAKKTKTIVLQNIILSLAIKFIILILSVFGFVRMWLSIFGDVGVCMLAILNSIRCLRYATKLKRKK